VVSFEKVFKTDALVIRIASIHKYDPMVMTSFKWDPSAPYGAGIGSISHDEKTIYLVKKNNGKFNRMNNYEVLNTEMRSLLFKHAYGYDMNLIDFGKLAAVQNPSFNLHQVPALLPSEINQGKLDDPTARLNFLFRDFGIVRVRTFNHQRKNHLDSPVRNQPFVGDD
jgi:hypothetical protein